MKTTLHFLTTAILTLSLIACTADAEPTNQQEESNDTQSITESNTEATSAPQNSFVSLFEIPATDISRAIGFYEAILDLDIEQMEMSGMEMGIFPYENQVVTGVIMKGEGYVPSADGVTIYLNGGDNLQTVLDKVEKNGGTIIVPKTAHADGSGFFALFLDSEGNKMGLNSPN
ncbi:MAG: VOC family protein [Crocinitomicaceae bacterium]